MANSFDEYERDYLKRLGQSEEKLEFEELDFVILGLMRNGIRKSNTIYKRLDKDGKLGMMKMFNHLKKLMELGYIKSETEGGWVERNTNPTVVLEKKGEDIVEKKILELEENWALLMKHYEAKEKEPLRNEMSNMKGMFPMMFIMGIANGAIMAQMLQMNHINMNDYFINEPIQIDYLTDPNGEPYTSESGGDFESGGFEAGF